MKSFLILWGMALVSVQSLYAQDIRVGRIGYGGNGCPVGSAHVYISDDQKNFGVLFEQFNLEAKLPLARPLRASCQLAIPVEVPEGYSIAVSGGVLGGYLSISEQTEAIITSELFFSGRTGPKMTKTFNGQLDTDYILNSEILARKINWSKCGEDVVIRINNSLLLNKVKKSNIIKTGALDSVFASVDFQGIYRILLKQCL